MSHIRKQKGPSKSFRTGITIIELIDKYLNKGCARKRFEKLRWVGGVRDCPHCYNINTREVKNIGPQPYQFFDCKKLSVNHKLPRMIAVLCVKERGLKKVKAQVIVNTKRKSLCKFVDRNEMPYLESIRKISGVVGIWRTTTTKFSSTCTAMYQSLMSRAIYAN